MFFSFLSEQQKGINLLVIEFVNSLKIKVTKNTILDLLQSHPDYPSLLSISDTLKKINIETLALKIDNDQFLNLPLPFIAIQNDTNNSFIIVETIDSNIIRLKKDNGEILVLKTIDFLKTFEGTVLLAEVTEKSNETNYQQKKLFEVWHNLRFPIIYSFLFSLGLIQIYLKSGFNLYSTEDFFYIIALYFLFFIGFIVSSILLWYEFDQDNAALKRVCTLGKESSCSAILNSKGSKLFNTISWSEIGLFYFAGSCLYICSNIQESSTINYISFFITLSIPYIVYSLFYQGVVIKKWCILCLSIQAILLSTFLLTIIFNHTAGTISGILKVMNLTALGISYLFLPLTWAIFKPFLYTNKKTKEAEYSLSRFKNNAYLFNTILKKEVPLINAPIDLGLSFGKIDAPNYLLKVCSPFCSACSKSHREIEGLLNNNSDWHIQIVFYISNTDDSNLTFKVAAHFLALYETKSKTYVLEALSYWYNSPNKNYELLIKKYPIIGSTPNYSEKIKAMNQWGQKENIQFTPTIYINSHRIPEPYSVADLYFL